MKNFGSFLVVFIFLFSCKSDDETIKTNLLELQKTYVSMSGTIGLYDALTFVMNDTAFIGMGTNFLGEDKHFYYYVPKYGTWEKIENEFPGDFRREMVAFAIGNKAYVGLGYTGGIPGDWTKHCCDDFFVYDNKTQGWESLAFEFPGKARWGAVAFTLNGKGYVGTGMTEEKDCLMDFYEFDPQVGWKRIPDIYNPRYRANAFVANGYAYVCFGYLYGDIMSGSNDNIQRYDPVANKWEQQLVTYEDKKSGDVLKVDRAISFVINKDGEDFVYVGMGNIPDVNLSSKGWGYNPRENVWKIVDSLAVGLYGFSVEGNGYIMGVQGGSVFEAYTFRAED